MTMAPWSVKAASLVLLLLPGVTALDVQIVNVTCDESLPVTADVYLQCEGGGKCTFGEDASVYGSCTCVRCFFAAARHEIFHPSCY
jgi:hypothetical protein